MPEVVQQKAYIKRLFLKNYKKFEDTSVEFTPGLNVLVGPNNAGKTTILEALDILLGERNLSPLAVKRSHFNIFKSGENNLSKLILEVEYPVSWGKKDKEVNFIKQLKSGKGSTRSKLPRLERSSHITVEEILSGTTNDEKWVFEEDTPKGGFTIKNIFLITEILVSSDFNPEVTYDIYLNIEKTDFNGQLGQFCYKIIGITGTQRSSLFNYLFMPANRINNKSLSEITDFNWLGRYIRNYITKNNLNTKLSDYTTTNIFPNDILDPQVQKVLNKLFTENEEITLDLINRDDDSTVVTNSRFYLKDGFNDELVNKAQGLQSAAIISLFSGWSKFQSESMPKNSRVTDMWNTVLILEEPESHFHYPMKNKLLRILKDNFLDHGAQIFISTHDNTFINWHYINVGNIVFPNSIRENKITSLDLQTIKDEYVKRIIRFNGNSFFTDVVLIVEGQEEICLDLLYQLSIKKSLQEEGIILTRVVGNIRSNAPENGDLQQSGGKNDVAANIEFFKSINIKPLCLVDIDVLFDNGVAVKNIYKELTGSELTLSKQYACSEGNYLRLRDWWISNKDDPDLQKDLKKLYDVGIFVFPGDFEALFTDSYLENYKNPKDENKLIKEKFTYETKYSIETRQDEFIENISELGESFLNESIQTIADFTGRFRKGDSEPEDVPEIIEPNGSQEAIGPEPSAMPF